jgi:ankyrin repeat protein
MTPLHLALTKDDVNLARSFIAHGADVHALDSIGRSPLMVAITYCPSAIGMLLDSGADRNEVSRFGPSLLAAARYQWLYHSPKRADQSENAVRILLENGVDPNTRDQDGRNALMVMSMEHRTEINISKIGPEEVVSIPSPINGLKESGKDGPKIHIGTLEMELDLAHNEALQLICETLIRAGCDINAADINGRTPLMYALSYNRPTAVRLLLLHGADIGARDKQCVTALELAKQIENKRIIGWLQHARNVR